MALKTDVQNRILLSTDRMVDIVTEFLELLNVEDSKKFKNN